LDALAPDIAALANEYGFPRAAFTASGAATPSGDDLVAEGRTIFNQHCAHCHAPNALSPEPTRDLRRLRRRYGDEWPQQFYATVRDGRPDKGMPRWSDTLDAARLDAVHAFLDSVQLPR
jgi:mono/diheme cytochrome c family protein